MPEHCLVVLEAGPEAKNLLVSSGQTPDFYVWASVHNS